MKSTSFLANRVPIFTTVLAIAFVVAPNASASCGTMVISTTTGSENVWSNNNFGTMSGF
jgi:hypothetical protein